MNKEIANIEPPTEITMSVNEAYEAGLPVRVNGIVYQKTEDDGVLYGRPLAELVLEMECIEGRANF